MTDEEAMQKALEQAKIAFSKGEVPIGAVLVHEGRVIAAAHNEVEGAIDASAHAECLCLRKGSLLLRNWRLLGCLLYSTLEPCLMCAGALTLHRVQKVIWGAKDPRHGAFGSLMNITLLAHPIHRVESQGGLFEQESLDLMQEFFRKRRKGSFLENG